MTQISVQDLMNRRVPCVSETAVLNDAILALLESDCSEVYVTSRAGILRGVVPDYEILKAHLCGVQIQEPVLAYLSRAQSVTPDRLITEIAGLFREGFRTALAVVDEHQRLLGQIKRREVIWLMTTLARVSESGPETEAPTEREPFENPIKGPGFLRRRRILRERLSR